METMVFQLWKDGVCFSQRCGDSVKTEYHNMKIGQCRDIGNGVEIWRIS